MAVCSTSGPGGPGFSGDWSLVSGSFQCPLSTAEERSRSRLSAIGNTEMSTAGLGNSPSQDLPTRIHYPSSLMNLPNLKSPNITTNIFCTINPRLSLVLPPLFVFSQYTSFRGRFNYHLASFRPSRRRPLSRIGSRFALFFVFDTPIDRSSSYLYNVVHAGAPDPAEAAASGSKQGAHRKRPGCN